MLTKLVERSRANDPFDPKRKFEHVLRLAAMQAAADVRHYDSDAIWLWTVVSDGRGNGHRV